MTWPDLSRQDGNFTKQGECLLSTLYTVQLRSMVVGEQVSDKQRQEIWASLLSIFCSAAIRQTIRCVTFNLASMICAEGAELGYNRWQLLVFVTFS